MSHRAFLVLLLISTLTILTACGPPKQTIPISTNPMGATVYGDGKQMCTTPCSVSFTRDTDHLLTIHKEGFEQVDMIISRRFKPDEAIRDGIISGILKGSDPEAVGSEVAREVDEQERSGEAYELTPSIVRITLKPESQ
ncbi:S-layer protein [Pseudodesulfovibrio profundus]|uniref:S-layer protein n=1 Tax=Pseudodesulfovibrio profundus TaxID=57320 RepID=A0A2C8FBU6_9BACT|nr:PEGA domain-containing protein [Pseudodesulfovibrio profundus]SOB60004.1 S-layer protein [Pseudodesulfovibrio profundus]